MYSLRVRSTSCKKRIVRCVGVWRDHVANVLGYNELMHHPGKPATVFCIHVDGQRWYVDWEQFRSMPSTRTQTNMHTGFTSYNIHVLRTAAEQATWAAVLDLIIAPHTDTILHAHVYYHTYVHMYMYSLVPRLYHVQAE